MGAASDLGELEQRLLRGRAYGQMSEAAQDALMDEMDALWEHLTVEEKAGVHERTAKRAKLMVGPDLDMVSRPGRSGELPRVPR